MPQTQFPIFSAKEFPIAVYTEILFKGAVTICAVTKLSILFDFGFGIRNQREKRK